MRGSSLPSGGFFDATHSAPEDMTRFRKVAAREKKNNEDAGICSDCDQSSNEIKTGENPSSDGTGDTGQCD